MRSSDLPTAENADKARDLLGRMPVHLSGGGTSNGWIEGQTPLSAAKTAYVVARLGHELK